MYDVCVDAMTSLLDGPRARQAFLLRIVMEPPWCIRVQDEAPLSILAIRDGEAWVFHDGQEPTELRRGDVIVVSGPQPYTFTSHPDVAPQVIVHPGQRCATVAGEDLAEAMSLGVRTWGNTLEGSSTVLLGTYERRSEVSRRFLDTLPPLIVLRADEWDSPVVSLLATEMARDEPGQEVVLDRLLDLLVIAVLRVWFARADAPPWYRAHADAVVGRALQLLHHNPAHPWTVAELASRVGLSRAALARRFNELVGEPPMTYLTGWRLALAADLLREPGSTLGAVAAEVGYSSPFALSTAFKRERGMSPQQYRTAV
jgi:AraC-like DNA-binding protein